MRAVPEEGYRLAEWSDGKRSETRTDYASDNLEFTATFEEIRWTFHYEYGLATANCTEPSTEISYHSLENSNLIVPKRDHFTFKGWYMGEQRISNELGDPIIAPSQLGQEGEFTLTAKWEPIETFTYKVLLVYVQEVHGTFKALDNSEVIKVDYKMSDLDRQICHLITKKVKQSLDEIMEGMVIFEVDEYFLLEPLTHEHFRYSTNAGWVPTATRGTKNINEIIERSPYYQTIITTYCLNDWDGKLTCASGLTAIGQLSDGTILHKEDVVIMYEALLRGLILNHEPVKNLLDETHEAWSVITGGYRHEFIHSIEMRISVKCGLHATMNAYYDRKEYNSNIFEKLYLLERAFVNGEYVGIPYEFWGDDEKKYL